MIDALETLGYFTGAWLFIFSKRFRTAWLEEFVDSSHIGRAFMGFEAAVAAALGFGLPIALLVWLLR